MRVAVGLNKGVRVAEVRVDSLSRMVSFPLNNAIVFWMNLVRLAVWAERNLKRCCPKSNVAVSTGHPILTRVTHFSPVLPISQRIEALRSPEWREKQCIQ